MDGAEDPAGQWGGVSGDIEGRDSTTGLGKQFTLIQQQIDERAASAVDKTELKDIVERIEQEVSKGETADSIKVERWLGLLAMVAIDVFQITVSTLLHPADGVAQPIRLIARNNQDDHAAKELRPEACG